MQQRNPWDNDAVVPTGGGMVITKAADPGRQYEGPTKAAQLDHIRLENARLARDAAQTGDGGEGALDPATRTYYAQQVLAGAPMPSLGMGKQAAAAKQAIMAEVARLGGASGLNGADQAAQLAHYKAGSGQIANLEKMAGTIGVNEQTALANGQQFLDRSRELPGQTRFQPLNAISDFIQRKAGGTTISAADAAYNTFVNEYAKVVAGSPSGAGVMSDSARHEAMSTISGSGSIEQKQAAFNQMKADMANRMNAIHGGINSAYKALTQQPGFQVPDSTQGLMAPGAASGAGGGGMPPSGGGRGVSSGGPASGLSVVGNNTGGSTIDPDRQRVGDKITSMLRDGVPDAQVLAFAKGSGYAGTAELSRIESNLAFRAAHPNALINYVTDPALKSKDGPQSIFDKYGPSGTGAFSTYAMNAASALSGNTLDNLTADPALARAGLAGASAANPTASLLGEITGAGLAAAGTELGVGAAAGRAGMAASPWVARGADALYGGVSGAGAADDGSRAGGALLGAGAGLGGGMFGRGLARTAAGAIGGVRNANVAYLRGQGVPLTVGQAAGNSGIVGSAVKGIEDRLSGIPIVGNMVNARRREGMEAFNRAAFDQALAPIGGTTNGAIREAGVDAARGARSQAYRDALDPVRLQADTPFLGDYGNAVAASDRLPGDMAGRAEGNLRYSLDNFDTRNVTGPQNFVPNATLTGDGFQQGVRRFRREGNLNANLPNGHDFGNVMQQGEDAFVGLLGRQSPQTMPAFEAANAANRNVSILQDAVNRGRSGTRVGDPGLFAPSQLNDAAAANARRFGGNQGTTNQPFFDLTRAGQHVLPSSIADSGTAGRLAVQGGLAALGGGIGAGAGYGGGDTATGAGGGLALAGLLAAGGSRAGQRVLTGALLNRPAAAASIAEQVLGRQRYLGMFGAGLATLPFAGQ